MKVILDRRSCTCWEAACESCFAGNLLAEFFVPACIVEEIDDGGPDLTVVLWDRDSSEKTLVVTEENWGAVFDSWMLAWQEAQMMYDRDRGDL
ncbi:MAG: hypothetical protein R3335_01285 [Anaerolineales bacterium]|nr:hypothetical protein [Anaerolineales bacterium]